MKKPRGESHKPRAHTEGLDEFSKLEQQYDSASIEERDRLHPDFIQAIRKKRPGLVEETWRALRSGDSLKATLRHSMKRVLDRHDLSAGRKTNAREDADAAMWVFDDLQRQDLEPKEMRGHAYELATRTLFIGLRAGLRPEEVEELRREVKSEHGQPGGKESTKTRREKAKQWRTWVTDQAPSMRGKHPTSGQEDLADKLIALALTKKVFVPDRSAVVKHLSALERTGQLSERTRSRGERTRSRTKPLR